MPKSASIFSKCNKFVAMTAVLLLCSFAGVKAQAGGPFEKGDRAYQGGKYAEALKWFDQAGRQGDGRAFNSLGVIYGNGSGVTQDYEKAYGLYLQAAAQGYEYGLYNLGILETHLSDEQVAAARKKVLEDSQRQAEQGEVIAQTTLGWMYEKAMCGLNEDDSQAVVWYLKAAKKGYAPAEYHLGAMYLTGSSVKQSYAKAQQWLEKAVEQGQSSALNMMGAMYENGWKVKQNYNKAYKLYTSAAAKGDAEAVINLQWLKAHMAEIKAQKKYK